MRATDGTVLANFSNATTQVAFNLAGGKYAMVTITGTPSSSNHVDLTVLGPDGSTYIQCIAGSQSATAAFTTADLPPGTYKWLVSGTLAGIYAELRRIPGE